MKLKLKLTRSELTFWKLVLEKIIVQYPIEALKVSPGEYALLTTLERYHAKTEGVLRKLRLSPAKVVSIPMQQEEALTFFYLSTPIEGEIGLVGFTEGTYEHNFIQTIRDSIHQLYLA